MQLLINNFPIILLNFTIISTFLLLMYLSVSLMVYIIGFLIIIINLGIILYSLNLEFISLWLFIIYGGSIIMFIIIISTLCRTEFNFFIFKNKILTQLLFDFAILSFFLMCLWKFLTYNIHNFQILDFLNWKSNLYYYLFITHSNLIIWIAVLLMIIMIFVVELQEYNRRK